MVRTLAMILGMLRLKAKLTTDYKSLTEICAGAVLTHESHGFP